MIQWFEQRLHLKKILTQPVIPQGWPGWSGLPGILVAMMFIWQMVMGMFLFTYECERLVGDSEFTRAPSLLQEAHRWGADFFLIFMFLYLGYKIAGTAYRQPYELSWGCLLVLVALSCLAFLTGCAACATNTQLRDLLQTIGELPLLWPVFSLVIIISQYRAYFFSFHVAVLPFGIIAVWLILRQLTALQKRYR